MRDRAQEIPGKPQALAPAEWYSPADANIATSVAARAMRRQDPAQGPTIRVATSGSPSATPESNAAAREWIPMTRTPPPGKSRTR